MASDTVDACTVLPAILESSELPKAKGPRQDIEPSCYHARDQKVPRFGLPAGAAIEGTAAVRRKDVNVRLRYLILCIIKN